MRNDGDGTDQPKTPRGDFLALLNAHGVHPAPSAQTERAGAPHTPAQRMEPMEGTTVLAMRYKDGALMAGDRRSTAGNIIWYERVDKVLAIDNRALLGVSGLVAAALETARALEFSFRYYRRSQLQEMSFDGKLRALSRLIASSGGAVMPIFAAFDANAGETRLFFSDAAGTQMEETDFTAIGSGLPWIKGALHYENRWRQKVASLERREALQTAIRLLQTAARFDSATGGRLPTVKMVSEQGVETVSEEEIAEIGADDV